jgi:riboflavin synthase
MFTGLIQQIGALAEIRTRSAGRSLVIHHAPWDPLLSVGESVAVQGACLTVTAACATEFACDVLKETLAKTSLGQKAPGARLNLERALRADERLGGHIVTGHVDGAGRLLGRERAGDDWVLEIGCVDELLSGIVPKGAVACDGVSLTVAELRRASFTVHLIPFTWAHTSLSDLHPGDAVNIETDVIGKYVQRHLAVQREGSGLTMDDLRKAGFAE